MATSLLSSFAMTIPTKKAGTTTTTAPTTRLKRRHFRPRMDLNRKPNPVIPKLVSTVGKFLWGQSLPPQLLISTVRSTWSAVWHLMMSQLAPSDPSGSYSRPASQFRSSSASRQKSGDLHLYVALGCPWAHRTLIVRALKDLEDAIPVSIASPGLDGSWEFRTNSTPNGETFAAGLDKANGCKTLREVYNLRQGGYDGRSTVPMLWDMETRDVVCNESYDIIELFNSGLNQLAGNPDLDLSPPLLKAQIDTWNRLIYPNVNNGVYRCGFAQSQAAYDAAVKDLFSTLDVLDDHLCRSRYLCGDVLTLADICLFTTLIRFDITYNVLFKCTKKKVVEYENLHGFMRDIYQVFASLLIKHALMS